jgi:hypothetical protein
MFQTKPAFVSLVNHEHSYFISLEMVVQIKGAPKGEGGCRGATPKRRKTKI